MFIQSRTARVSLFLALALTAVIGGRFARPGFVAWRGRQTIPATDSQMPGKPPTAAREPARTNQTPKLPEGFYLGKGDERIYINYASSDPVLRSVLQSVMDGSSDPNVQGRQIFLKICAACHQRDGDGKEGVAPPLLGSEWVLAPGGQRLARIVLNGLTGPIQVRGQEWNLPMLPWRANLDDDQAAVVLTYIRSQLGSNHAGPITPEVITEARKEVRTKPETAEELWRIPDR